MSTCHWPPFLWRGSLRSDQFDDGLPRVEGGDDRVEGCRKRREQFVVSAVAQPYPQEPTRVMRLAAQVKKVLVLAYDDPGVIYSQGLQSPVVEQVEPTLENVFGVMSAIAEPTGQGRRQLVIDQKPHATSTTTWFVC